MPTIPRVGRALACLALVVSIMACQGATTPPSFTRVSQPVAAIGAAIPAPADPILVITGDIASTNGDGLALDVPAIEALGLVRYTVRDPWLEQELEFTGVLLTDLLAAAGANPDATTLHITALDDYEVEISIADVRRWPVMLATQTAGAPMSIEDKGPTRIVFPADPTIDALRYKDLWIWQLKTIEVR
jgi:hypothetical protein